jgi:hypothetical protein
VPPLAASARFGAAVAVITGSIEAALAPLKPAHSASYRTLCAALAMIFGAESMIVFRDVLGADEKTERKVKGWRSARS